MDEYTAQFRINRPGSTADQQLEDDTRTFLNALRRGMAPVILRTVAPRNGTSAMEFLTRLVAAAGRGGIYTVETAMFVFSLKQPLFARIRKEFGERCAGVGG